MHCFNMPGCGLQRHGPHDNKCPGTINTRAGDEWRKQSSDMQTENCSGMHNPNRKSTLHGQEIYISAMAHTDSLNEDLCIRCPTVPLYITLINQILRSQNGNAFIGRHFSLTLNPFNQKVSVHCPTIYL